MFDIFFTAIGDLESVLLIHPKLQKSTHHDPRTTDQACIPPSGASFFLASGTLCVGAVFSKSKSSMSSCLGGGWISWGLVILGLFLTRPTGTGRDSSFRILLLLGVSWSVAWKQMTDDYSKTIYSWACCIVSVVGTNSRTPGTASWRPDGLHESLYSVS